MGKHTELPWEIREPNGQGNGFLVGPVWIGGGLHDGRGGADAELVHVSTKYHARLVEALRALLKSSELQPVTSDDLEIAEHEARTLLAQLDGENK